MTLSKKDWKFISNTPLIRLHLNARVGDVRPLLMQYDGVIIATGEPNTAQLNIEGEELCLSHMEYLHHPERYATSGRVAVIGGGNVAADCAFYGGTKRRRTGGNVCPAKTLGHEDIKNRISGAALPSD